MSRFTFDLATPADDGQLRELLSATPMAGSVCVAFAREPSYFGAAAVDGRIVQVGVARDDDLGRIIGMGSRSISQRQVNGRRVDVGYLGGLRLRGDYRGHAGLLARGYRFLRELHQDHRTPFYLTTIAADNDQATSLLTSGRAGLPVYHAIGNFQTLLISPARGASADVPSSADIVVRPAQAADRDAILAFINTETASRQFFPVYEPADLFSETGLLKGLQPADVLLAFRAGQLVGTLGCWDQRRFKQVVVHHYEGWLRRLRPVHNAWARFRHQPVLPPAGTALRMRLAAIPVVINDDRDVFHQLLVTMLRQMSARDERLLLLGLHESDPLLPVARQYSGRVYSTRLYVVYWPASAPDVAQLTRRVPYLELGAL